MKRSYCFLACAIIVIFALSGCASNNNSVSSSMSQSSNSSSISVSSAQKNQITIKDFAFAPAVLTVKVGDTVTWQNMDSATHSIGSTTFNNDSTTFTSPDIAQSKTFSKKFDKKGTYDYYCGIHTYMKGQIVVQ
jgi:plastocyanin